MAYGIKESLRVNLVLVGVKLFIVLFVIIAGIGFINTDNYKPFIPPSESIDGSAEWLHTPLLQLITGSPAAYGVGGVLFAASLVFFAYIGFDVVATTAEEARNPQRDLPRGIIGSLMICTILYVAVALVITGMVNYDDINPDAALAQAFIAQGKDGYATLISAGAVAGLTTVVMTLMIGAVRVTFAMSRDNLLPLAVGHVSPQDRHAGPAHDRRRHRRRLRRLADPGREAGGDGQHRHPDGVLPGVDRDPDPAQEPPRPEAVVQGAAGRRSLPWLVGRHLPVPDDQPDRGDLAPVPGLDGARLRHLLRLRLPAQPGRHGAWESRRRTTPASACGRSSPSSEAPATSTPCCRWPRAVAAAGHDVAVAGSSGQLARVAEAGFTALATSQPRPPTTAARANAAGTGACARQRGRVRRELRRPGARRHVAAVPEHLERWRPDVVVRDETDFGTAMAAERLRRAVRHRADPGGRHAAPARAGRAGARGHRRASTDCHPTRTSRPCAATWCCRRSRRRSATRRCRCPPTAFAYRPRALAPEASRTARLRHASARSSTSSRATCSSGCSPGWPPYPPRC